jgi:hypothetical protein
LEHLMEEREWYKTNGEKWTNILVDIL